LSRRYKTRVVRRLLYCQLGPPPTHQDEPIHETDDEPSDSERQGLKYAERADVRDPVNDQVVVGQRSAQGLHRVTAVGRRWCVGGVQRPSASSRFGSIISIQYPSGSLMNATSFIFPCSGRFTYGTWCRSNQAIAASKSGTEKQM
jgi:hypothetical protein